MIPSETIQRNKQILCLEMLYTSNLFFKAYGIELPLKHFIIIIIVMTHIVTTDMFLAISSVIDYLSQLHDNL